MARSVFDLTLAEMEELEQVIGGPVGLLFQEGPQPAAAIVGEAWLAMKEREPDLTVDAFLARKGDLTIRDVYLTPPDTTDGDD